MANYKNKFSSEINFCYVEIPIALLQEMSKSKQNINCINVTFKKYDKGKKDRDSNFGRINLTIKPQLTSSSRYKLSKMLTMFSLRNLEASFTVAALMAQS